MTDIKVCTIGEDVKEVLKKFRFRKATNNAGIILKVDPATMNVVIDEEVEDCSLDELASQYLPEFSPRYIVYSYCYKQADGRTSYPLVFIFFCPPGVKPEQNMIYAGTKPAVVHTLQITKLFEVQHSEDLTEEWLLTKLAFFR